MDTAKDDLIHLTNAAMQRLAKPRAGFESFVKHLITLAEENPSLRPSGFDANEARAIYDSYVNLQSTLAEALLQVARVRQTRFLHAAYLWRMMRGIYRRALIEAPTDSGIAYQIARFAHFMKLGPRKKPSSTTR